MVAPASVEFAPTRIVVAPTSVREFAPTKIADV